jgi:hypothetical protein
VHPGKCVLDFSVVVVRDVWHWTGKKRDHLVGLTAVTTCIRATNASASALSY